MTNAQRARATHRRESFRTALLGMLALLAALATVGTALILLAPASA